MKKSPKHLLTLFELDRSKVSDMIVLAAKIKRRPFLYRNVLRGKSLMMIFEKPSLRTRVSFEVGMKSLGGFTVVIDKQKLPGGASAKESVSDTSKVSSRYVDGIMARLFEQKELEEMAQYSTIPVINGLTNEHHPVQILCDLLTIYEKKGKLHGLKLCYMGDGLNNVTHSLIIGCAMMGMDISVASPKGMEPDKTIIERAQKLSNAKIVVTQDVALAVKDADVIYADSWMSYHVAEKEKAARMKKLMPYQVNINTIVGAKPDFIFMNCLPAMRGYEQTAEIIDGPHSVVFDQAENRLHMQKALLVTLLR